MFGTDTIPANTRVLNRAENVSVGKCKIFEATGKFPWGNHVVPVNPETLIPQRIVPGWIAVLSESTTSFDRTLRAIPTLQPEHK